MMAPSDNMQGDAAASAEEKTKKKVDDAELAKDAKGKSPITIKTVQPPKTENRKADKDTRRKDDKADEDRRRKEDKDKDRKEGKEKEKAARPEEEKPRRKDKEKTPRREAYDDDYDEDPRPSKSE